MTRRQIELLRLLRTGSSLIVSRGRAWVKSDTRCTNIATVNKFLSLGFIRRLERSIYDATYEITPAGIEAIRPGTMEEINAAMQKFLTPKVLQQAFETNSPLFDLKS